MLISFSVDDLLSDFIMIACQGWRKRLSGILRHVTAVVTMSGLIRFLVSPGWSVADVETMQNYCLSDKLPD